MDMLYEHGKNLPDLKIGDSVLVQNQLGNEPRRWERRGKIVEVMPFRQYKVMLDGSRRITLRKRKFVRKYQPLKVTDCMKVPTSHYDDHDEPTAEGRYVTVGSADKDHEDSPKSAPFPSIPDPIDISREEVILPQLIPPSPKTPVGNNELAPKSTITVERITDLEPLNPPRVFSPAEIPMKIEQPQSLAVRRSSRMNKGTTRKYDHYTGSEYDHLS